MRVTLRLTDRDYTQVLWSRSYDRALTTSNIFDVQADLSAAIVGQLAQVYGVINQAAAKQLRRTHPKPCSPMIASSALLPTGGHLPRNSTRRSVSASGGGAPRPRLRRRLGAHIALGTLRVSGRVGFLEAVFEGDIGSWPGLGKKALGDEAARRDAQALGDGEASLVGAGLAGGDDLRDHGGTKPAKVIRSL